MTRALVTGGAGFIGSSIVARLLEDGHEVRVLDSFATGRRTNLDGLDGVELVEGDVQSYERAAKAAAGCEVVFHQAALPSVPRSIQDPLMTNSVNVTGTLNVLLAARDAGVRRVMFASSSSVYGANPDLPKTETMRCEPISPYAVSKLAGEQYCRAFTEVFGLECVALRYFNVFGPRQDPASQYAAVIPRFVEAALLGRRPVVFGDGRQTRDFTFIDNVVDANMLAMDAPSAQGRVINVACGHQISLLDVIDAVAAITGVTVVPEHLAGRAGEVKHSMASPELARTVLGWVPRVDFETGLRRTIESHDRLRDMSVR